MYVNMAKKQNIISNKQFGINLEKVKHKKSSKKQAEKLTFCLTKRNYDVIDKCLTGETKIDKGNYKKVLKEV